jgi:hypothetical protein
MPSKPHNLWYVLRESFANWTKHDATTHSAVATVKIPLETA